MVNVGRCFVIAPATPTPTPTAPICISDLDQEKPIIHALVVYFYRPSDSFTFASASKLLRDSLSQALVTFYPLAGRLHYVTGTGGRVALDCNAADPAPSAPRFKHDRFEPNPLLIGQLNDHEERNKKTKILILHLSRDQVQSLKVIANETRPAHITRPFSRFEAVAGHIWRCASKARGHQPMQYATNKTVYSG
ncbi:hypothetical protein R6Q57_007409 [Mikania cordata]